MANSDLSRLDPRTNVAARPTNNRAGTLPTRNVRAPELEINARMGTARRGDGGADELKRVLGLVNRTAQGVADIQSERDERLAERQRAADAATGMTDAATGKDKDAERAKRSRAYADGYSVEAARAQGVKLTLETGALVDELLNDPEKRADLDDVNEAIEAHYRSTLMDETGNLRDFGSPEATRAVAQAASDARQKALIAAQQVITDRVHTEHLGNMAVGAKAEFAAGTLDVETLLARRLPGMSAGDTRSTMLTVLLEDADERGDVAGMNALLGAKRADGQSSWSPDQVKTIRNQRDQTQTRLEVAERRRVAEVQEATMDALTDRYNFGKPPTRTEITKLRSEGKLDAEHVSSLFGWMEADAREARANAREIAASQTLAEQRRADTVGNDIVARYVTGSITSAQAMKEIARANADGAFGVGDVRKRATSETAESIRKLREIRATVLATPEGRRGFAAIDASKAYIEQAIKRSKRTRDEKARIGAELHALHAEALAAYGSALVDGGKDPTDVAERLSNWLMTRSGSGTSKKARDEIPTAK
ncbi:hypothetical protein [Sphingosinicella microcystinivorans]|uniref:Uncharacterized protein n=1 Tax=Sphingosinicella microcystinivorans TaxID=335406 RepID=A0AAD1D4U1_SPHMI|nr:hypothetical protein [Sphingosinicella microcystinivorans]RKS90914.1 hypothetical protein DFR51_0458 [Sphingosinicella microcystinivorans]BBE33831.1 hypothetical protein SmB9_14890 [Sphingosinicella microcystinivorans]